MDQFDLLAHLRRQIDFSYKTFGPGARTQGVVDHIKKELTEIEKEPHDLEEWIDVIILAFDGAWRTGARAEDIITMLVAKQTKNESRTWPDWRTAPLNQAIEHTRTEPAAYIATCSMCEKDIESDGRGTWRHVGEPQPRHPALPK